MVVGLLADFPALRKNPNLMRALIFLGSPGQDGKLSHFNDFPLLDRWFGNIHNDTVGFPGRQTQHPRHTGWRLK